MVKNYSREQITKSSAWSGLLVLVLIGAGGLTVSLRGVDIFGLAAAATSSLIQAPVTLYLIPYNDAVIYPGDTKKIDVSVNAREPINAIGATIKFPQETMEIIAFSKEKSFFDLWTEETAISEESGEIHFSGGTTKTGGLTGTGTVITLTVRAKKSGVQNIFFKDSQIYSADGAGTLLDNESRSISFNVVSPASVPISSGATVSQQTSLQPEKPLPKGADFNNDGAINLIDMSIMILRLVMSSYDQRYDLNMDGVVNISDLSVLLAQVR
jgi:hypothetical protein